MERADIKMAIDIVDQFDEPQADHVACVLIGCGNEITRLRQQVATLTEQRDMAVEALRKMNRAYVSLMENGRDRIVMLGGECDPVDVMERADPALIEAKKALAAIQSAEVTK